MRCKYFPAGYEILQDLLLVVSLQLGRGLICHTASTTINSDVMNAYPIKVTIQLQMYVVWIPTSIHLLKPVTNNSDTYPNL